MATYFIRKATDPVNGPFPGTRVDAADMASAVNAFSALPGHAIMPGETVYVSQLPAAFTAVQTVVVNQTPMPALPPVGT